ncbi:MAG: flagellar brake protein [Burkholderiales bacterium]|nr:flagellar brake protein [Nitrosomonas sp.]MCP5274213.1 flagellar brake protein [Burkholderiales bacterium]
MVESIHNTESSDIKNCNNSSPDEIETCRIYSKIEVFHILQEIMKKNTLVTLYFDQSNRFILTSIIGIDNNQDEMLIDYGVEPEINELTLKSTNLTFITSQNRIKIEFTCNQIRRAHYENRDVFAVKLPESLIRMQRRSYYRIPTPITKPLKCIIPIPQKEVPFKAEITLIDISCGGIGVIDHHPVISFEPGIIYHDCQINLPGFGSITATIEVKTTYEITLKNGQLCKRAGCQFIDLPTGMETTMRRFITKQEQTRIAP